ncbi:MAG: hypothetical protein WD492_07085 [Alkalispirochaeta sp.]
MGLTTVRENFPALWMGILAMFVAGGIEGQSFRGEVSVRETLTAQDAVERSISSGDILLLHLDPSAVRFVAGLDIVIEPESDSIAPGSFSAAIFGAVDPPEATGVQNLAGQRLQTLPLTDPLRHRIFVPFGSDGSGIQNNATQPIDPHIGDIAIQLVPIMKGMDSRALSVAYSVSVTPRLRPIGAARIVLEGDDDLLRQTRDALELSLDGETIEADTVVERAPGIYRLTAQAGDFLDVTSNVGIEQGRLREITLEPREPLAMIRVSVPTVAEVYWNGTRLVDYDSFSAPPGEHSIMIRLGDFTVSRRIELDAHENYEVAIDLDILIKRN